MTYEKLKHGDKVCINPINYWYQKYLLLKAEMDKMKAGAVEGVVEDWNPEPHPEITIPLNPEEFTAGDKVKLIVIKED